MSVLDTFVLLFEADVSQGKQGMDEAKRSAKELEGQLKATDQVSEKLGGSFIELASSMGGFLAATLSFGAISAAVVGAANFADKLGETSDRLGVSVEQLSIWGDAAKISGGSAEGFIGSLDSLNASLTQMDVTGKSRALPFLKELGIDMESAAYKGKTAMELLPDIAEAMGNMEKTQAIGIGKKLGLDMGTIMMLQSGKRSLDELLQRQKELGVVTQKQAEISAEFNDALDDTAHSFRGVWLGIAESVLPALTWVMEKFQMLGQFLSKHGDFVTGIFIALGAAITYFVVPPLISAGIVAAVAFAPFLLIGAAVTAVGLAFALLYDDIMNFIEGNDSMIGQMMEKYPIIGQLIGGIKDALTMLWDAFSWVFDSIQSILQISIAGWELLFGTIFGGIRDFIMNSEFMIGIASAIQGAFSAMGDAVGAVWDWLGEKVLSFMGLIERAIALVKAIAGGITGALDSIKGSLGITVEKKDGEAQAVQQNGSAAPTPAQTMQAVAQGQQQIAMAATNPITSQTTNSINNAGPKTTNKNTNVQVGSVVVNTQATDADGVARAVGGTLNNQLRQTVSNFDDGVLA